MLLYVGCVLLGVVGKRLETGQLPNFVGRVVQADGYKRNIRILTFLLLRDRQNVAQHTVVFVFTALPTMLEPRMRITNGLQSLMVCILPTMHCRPNNVGSCCIRWDVALSD